MKPDKQSSQLRIRHILKAILDIQTFTQGITFEDFKNDLKAYYACLYQFAVIGEAVVHMDPDILASFEYPWYKVRSFRNFIMHEYQAIDEKVVWDTIEQELPEFRKLMERILEVG